MNGRKHQQVGDGNVRFEPREKRALELRAELDAAKLSRRELAKLGLIAGGSAYAKGASLRAAIAKEPAARPLTPWKDEMPVPPKTKVEGYDYSHADHQWSQRYDASATRCYEIKQREHNHRFHSDLEASTVWSFDSIFGGPVHDAWYGKAFCFRIKNELPADHKGYGSPETTSHLHNMHTATESDGGPWNWLTARTPRGSSITACPAPASPTRWAPATPTIATRPAGRRAAAGGRATVATATCARR